MFCSKCGQQNLNSAFCSGCGASVVGQPASFSGTAGGSQSTSSPLPVTNPNPYSQPSYQPGYSQPQYAQPAYPSSYSPPVTNGKAVASLILALFGISLLAVIFGHMAQSEINKSQGRQGGQGLAIVGLVFGWLGMAGWFVFWIVIFSAAAFY